jgi:tetratricopeptide (TPR) repeat protein
MKSLLQAVTATRSARCRAGALLGLVLLATSPLAAAQRERQLQYLLFEPVVLELMPAAEAGAEPLRRETRALPSGNKVTLRDWLVANSRDFQPRTNGDIAAYERAIAELEIAEGPFSPALPQQLLALGDLLQASGEIDRALQYYEQASHITRINHGLYSTEQVAAVERIISAHLSRGDLAAADQQHNYLMFLQQRNLGKDNVDLLPALTRYAEWNVFAFTAEPLGGKRDYVSSDEAIFRLQRLLNAQHVYGYIIELLRKHFGPADPRLLDAEIHMAHTNYLFAASYLGRVDPYALNEIDLDSTLVGAQLRTGSIHHMGFRHGNDALERRLQYLREMPGVAAKDIAAAALDLADWSLLFGRQRLKTVESYATLYAQQATRLAAEDLEQLFSPDYPVALPAFIPPSYSREERGIPPEVALEYEGYIDVEFNLNRFGKVSKLAVLGKSEETPGFVEERLVRMLRDTQFRPRLLNGKPRDSDQLQVRYYYAW